MASEITEEWAEDGSFFIPNKEAQKERIRQIITYQKTLCRSLYVSSPSTSSSFHASSSDSSFSSSRRNGNLLKLMKGGATSLRRLFDMEYDYGVSMISPVLEKSRSSLVESFDSPVFTKKIGFIRGFESEGSGSGHKTGELNLKEKGRRNILSKFSKPKLFRILQRLVNKNRWRRFGLRLRLRRFRVLMCGSKR